MIKFFRQIRKSLLSEGKTGKYLKYAIGEIVLVVIGILIALQINLKSQEKTNREHVESILKSVYFNLESDMANPINRFIGFCEFKDSLNTMLLTKNLSYKDYELSGQGHYGLGRLLTYEFEPFQFENQAYERLVANIEIIPDEYMPIVKMLQDVYSKEVPVVNEVAIEVKNFVDEIEDKYQSSFDWYSNTDSTHFRQKVNYMLDNPKHLNDVRRHQYIIDHLLGHMNTLKTNVSIAYSKIHNELMFDEPFSEIVERFYFPKENELKKYTGIYEFVDNPSNTMEFVSKDYYLTLGNGNGFKLINIADNKFAASIDTKGSYIEFIEDEKGDISALTFNRIREKDTISALHKKIK
ncbi:hypothetical protein RM697_09060 [Ichthyenterobacterium sp. W332]|uniref:Uncharacterized protein n=1 Tax=Microcosmobacter mediterraneus TaxID=3075607 RepID=A0ABU2YKX7_9FLAO|nr:hypothetical protein [Ichthyenterobacterium sp. W332]MDT0558796.1 hypothetical protein [Ichthyenterobacterium sp. W332]